MNSSISSSPVEPHCSFSLNIALQSNPHKRDIPKVPNLTIGHTSMAGDRVYVTDQYILHTVYSRLVAMFRTLTGIVFSSVFTLF